MRRRSYRSVLAAAAALLLSSNAAANSLTESRGAASDSKRLSTAPQNKGPLAKHQAPPVEKKPKFKAFPEYSSEACYHAETYDAAYLCSAWRSAVAAEQAAQATKRANDLALLALLLSVLGVGGLVATLWQANRALGEARRSADAAERAIAETREVGEAQVRCYLTLSAANIAFYVPDLRPRLGLTIQNVGQSPAFEVTWAVELQYSVLGQPDRRSISFASSVPALTLPPGAALPLIPEVFDFALNLGEQAHIAGPGDMLGVAAKVVLSAKDVFGKAVSSQALYCGGIDNVDVVLDLAYAGGGLPAN